MSHSLNSLKLSGALAWMDGAATQTDVQSPNVASSWWSRPARISKRDLADATAQLSIMTKSGVDLSTALGSLIRQCQRAAMIEVLEGVHEDVLAGLAFSEALRRRPHAFDESLVATIAAGELSGRLPEVLAQLAELQRSEIRLSRAVRAMLTYPVLLMVVSSVVTAALVLLVLPQFAEIFKQYETPLPMSTQALLAIADEARGRWWLWGPLGAAAVIGLVSLRFSEFGRTLADRTVLDIPGLGRVVRLLKVGRFCRLTGLMVENGVPLVEALGLVAGAMKSPTYRRLVHEVVDSISNGRSLAAPLMESDLFPPSATEMIATAERTGRLGEVLRTVGAYFEEEGEAATRGVVALAEPTITVVMGGVVAVVVMSVMLPVFDLSTLAGKH